MVYFFEKYFLAPIPLLQLKEWDSGSATEPKRIRFMFSPVWNSSNDVYLCHIHILAVVTHFQRNYDSLHSAKILFARSLQAIFTYATHVSILGSHKIIWKSESVRSKDRRFSFFREDWHLRRFFISPKLHYSRHTLYIDPSNRKKRVSWFIWISLSKCTLILADLDLANYLGYYRIKKRKQKWNETASEKGEGRLAVCFICFYERVI